MICIFFFIVVSFFSTFCEFFSGYPLNNFFAPFPNYFLDTVNYFGLPSTNCFLLHAVELIFGSVMHCVPTVARGLRPSLPFFKMAVTVSFCGRFWKKLVN